jgi:prepilin signal peptidase PulO-like enzyme (type II secretory pathway)
MKKVLVFVLIMIVIMLFCSTVALAADGTEELDGGGFWGYIAEGVYYLVPALYVVGLFIKKIPKIPDWIIPITLLVLGVVASMAILGWNVDSAIQGVLVAGVTVFVNQAYKQTFINSKTDST